MRRLTVVALVALGGLLARSRDGEVQAAAGPRPRKVVLLAGPLDESHPPGTHEYERSARLLQHCLNTSPDGAGVCAEVHLGGWPKDPRTLDDADTIVLISSGSDRRAEDHPLLAGDRLPVLARQMRRGCGLVLIHWSTFLPRERAGAQALDWVGGYFDYQSGPKPRGWYSKIRTLETTARPASRAHPVCRGVTPFAVREEFYYNIRFRERDPRLVPLLTAHVPGEKEDPVVAWGVQRKDGGRGFGFTGGHYFDNWKVEPFRRLVLNAILWTARAEVPAGGVRSALPAGDRPRLTAGKFGHALDAKASPVVSAGQERYRRPPLTVECWARLNGRTGFNVLVASDPKRSARHWEIYSYARSGAFSAYLPGSAPSEIVSEVNICDGKWHYLAMTHDGSRVRLYVDGKQVKDQPVKPKPGLKPIPGPLTIGMALEEGTRVGCDGAIDDLRISRVARAIAGVPTAELPRDPDTIGLWHFNGDEKLEADRAPWTPPPVEGGEPWERETDKDWADARFRAMDTGPYLNATVAYPSWRGKVRAYKATAIRLGQDGTAAVVFDRNQLRLAAGWTGGYLDHSDRRFGLLNTPTPAGPLTFTTSAGPGWADAKGSWDCSHPPTAPLPRSWAKFKGLHLHGRRVVLAYTVGGTEVHESPWVESGGGLTVLTRTVEVGPSARPLKMLACEFPTEGVAHAIGGVPLLAAQRDGAWTAVALVGPGRGATLERGGRTRAEVHLPAATTTRRFQVILWHGRGDLKAFAKRVSASPAPADLKDWTKAGPARWTKPMVTRGEVSPDSAPYVIDTLTVPYDNPYKALMFLAGVDFMPDGDLAVCTAHGDVWLVKGAGARLDRLVWKRFATGLYQPLGLRVLGGKIHVLERGQLTRLHDRNGDGEADFYENVNNDWHTGGGEHSYDTCLETDSAGNFYFFKTGDTNTPTGGCLLRVTADGSKSEVFATGFRHPIGLSVGPDDTVTGADQEGNWMPATRIDQYQKGGFYGDMRAHHRATAPATYDGPLLWLPKEADNSAGGQVWVQGDKFGLPAGQLLHLSYGRCRLFTVLRQTVAGQAQAGAADFGLFFLSGAMRGRFRPGDGQLYVAGLRGWQTAARRDGCLQRVRYTGQPVRLPAGLAVHADGIRVSFAQKLDPKVAADPRRYRLEQWNYRWRAEYGSKHWSVAHPGRAGHDALAVESATPSPDGRSAFLRVRGLAPVMQMKIAYDLKTADGEPLAGTIYHTIHRPAPAEKR